MDLYRLIKEAKLFGGRGSLSGRDKGIHSKHSSHTVASKSKVKVFNSITDALSKAGPGTIFSTKDSDRLYVITVQKWGKDDEQMVNGKTAKGFSTDTPFNVIKKYAARTRKRHGKSSVSSLDKYFERDKK